MTGAPAASVPLNRRPGKRRSERYETPFLAQFGDLALLLMRLLVGVVFIASGWSHAKDPVTRGKSIGLSPGFTRFLGLAELFGGAGVALGILPQLAALGLILVCSGPFRKRSSSGIPGSGENRAMAGTTICSSSPCVWSSPPPAEDASFYSLERAASAISQLHSPL